MRTFAVALSLTLFLAAPAIALDYQGGAFQFGVLGIDQPHLAGKAALGAALERTGHAATADEGQMPGRQQALEVVSIHVSSRLGTWQDFPQPLPRSAPRRDRFEINRSSTPKGAGS